MTTQEFLQSFKGIKRIRAIAYEINNNHRICMRQCIELARKEVETWFNMFNPMTEIKD